jgi:hypothetical protein
MAKTIPPQVIRKLISYYYLVSYCPPEYINEFKEASQKMFTTLVDSTGYDTDEMFALTIPEVARRIMAFHLATREPDPDGVAALAQMLKIADKSPQETAIFQRVMHLIAVHPSRSKLDNRLHRNKGCAFCTAPCRYGYFTLVSNPDFITLKALLDAENRKFARERDAVKVLWNYTKKHVWSVLGTEAGFIRPEDLGNLSYCLLLLGTAKSRFALPEAQLKRYQELTLLNVQRLRDVPISLS